MQTPMTILPSMSFNYNNESWLSNNVTRWEWEGFDLLTPVHFQSIALESLINILILNLSEIHNKIISSLSSCSVFSVCSAYLCCISSPCLYMTISLLGVWGSGFPTSIPHTQWQDACACQHGPEQDEGLCVWIFIQRDFKGHLVQQQERFNRT